MSLTTDDPAKWCEASTG